MFSTLFTIIVGLIGGVAAGLQGPFTGIMGSKIGDLGSVFITYCGGAVVIALIGFGAGLPFVAEARSLPWYVFLAGPLGLVVIGALSYSIPRLGATASTMLFVAAWLAISATLDHFGWLGVDVRPLNFNRIIGLLALTVGTWLVIR